MLKQWMELENALLMILAVFTVLTYEGTLLEKAKLVKKEGNVFPQGGTPIVVTLFVKKQQKRSLQNPLLRHRGLSQS